MTIKNIYWNGANAVYRNDAETPPFHADDIDLKLCCCPPLDCPGDCDPCDDPITAHILGVGGACPAYDPCADTYNGNWTLNRIADSCTWTDAQGFLSLYCYLQYWILRDTTGAACVGWTAKNFGCPPATGWIWDADYANCTEGTLALS